MPADRAAAPARPVPLERLLAGRAPEPAGDDPAGEITAGRPVVVLDDDPTGTQTTAGLPVLTSWAVEDVEWAFRRGGAGFFVLTNTRSLAGPDAARRTREVARAVHEAATRCGLDYALASRGDSTLRGHFPLETDVLAEELGRAGTPVDGLLVAPAFVEPGRLTVDGVHWTRTTGPDGAAGMVPVAQSEFARDATFGYAHSDLRDWIEERTAGRVRRADVATITLDDLRTGGPDRVRDVLAGLRGGRPVVADAASDADLRVLALGVARAEAGGTRLLYRVGPSFVRARTGQRAAPPLAPAAVAALRTGAGGPPAGARGLVVAGSHVGLTTRQLDRLRAGGGTAELELDVPTLLRDGGTAHVGAVADRAVALLADPSPGPDVVLRTSRALVTGADADASLAVARTVSAALVTAVRHVVERVRPAFVLAKGGITASDTATGALGIRRAWSRGTLLPGIVSLWEPVGGPAAGVPFVVFAGNVGDDDALARAVAVLHGR